MLLIHKIIRKNINSSYIAYFCAGSSWWRRIPLDCTRSSILMLWALPCFVRLVFTAVCTIQIYPFCRNFSTVSFSDTSDARRSENWQDVCLLLPGLLPLRTRKQKLYFQNPQPHSVLCYSCFKTVELCNI